MFGPIARLLRKQQEQQAAIHLEVKDSGLTEEQIETGLEALRLLQLSDHQDDLQRDECLDVLFAVGLNPTLDALEGRLRQLGLHRRSTLTWGELTHVWKLLLSEPINEEEILEQAFAFFDRDGNKEISIAELTTTMKELGDLLSAEEIGAFVAIMDKNADGVVGYEEFLQALHNELPVSASHHRSSVQGSALHPLQGRDGPAASAAAAGEGSTHTCRTAAG